MAKPDPSVNVSAPPAVSHAPNIPIVPLEVEVNAPNVAVPVSPVVSSVAL